ncbi:hypothetical protein [Gottfriedia acidiceleris]|uniref:Uncharacterized protein n=1 Tax=Gottfriedia acidiceleris TaxID=371036 RepID=A0ABY4JJS0_9BACI|nr:hypothetical protein [Gottfriedia acidiceleris]UPM54089.1 hypothetical protein MY490_20480 [Gottfriedia acidiceleris]
MKKQLCLFILIITLIALIAAHTACNSQKYKKHSNYPVLSAVAKLEGSSKKEKNYLFFNKNETTKRITLYFYDNYKKEPITYVRLFRDNVLVSKNTKVIDTSIHDNGIFIFELHEYVKFFNNIELGNHNGRLLKLKTGDYHFELIDLVNNIENDYRWYLDSYSTGEGNFKFEMNANFSRANSQKSQFEINSAYKKLNGFSITEVPIFKERGNTLSFKYSAISSTKEAGSYEVLVVQKNSSGQKYIMSSVIVPLKE